RDLPREGAQPLAAEEAVVAGDLGTSLHLSWRSPLVDQGPFSFASRRRTRGPEAKKAGICGRCQSGRKICKISTSVNSSPEHATPVENSPQARRAARRHIS